MFKLENSDIENNSFHIQYNIVEDKYSIPSRANNEASNTRSSFEIKGWKSCLYNVDNMQYKMEDDWKMCYLARSSGENAFIEWCFDLSALKQNSSKRITRMEIKCESKCFEDGQVEWKLYWTNKTESNKYDEKNQIVLNI